jgi:hypothetical protein
MQLVITHLHKHTHVKKEIMPLLMSFRNSSACPNNQTSKPAPPCCQNHPFPLFGGIWMRERAGQKVQRKPTALFLGHLHIMQHAVEQALFPCSSQPVAKWNIGLQLP